MTTRCDCCGTAFNQGYIRYFKKFNAILCFPCLYEWTHGLRDWNDRCVDQRGTAA